MTIYHGDAIDLIGELAQRATIIVTDPPFGIAHDPALRSKAARAAKRRGRDGDYWPESTWDSDLTELEALKKIPVDIRALAVFGFWRNRDRVAALVPRKLKAEIVWAKDVHTTPPQPVASRDERIWLFGDVTPTRFETSVWDQPVIPTWAHKRHKNEKPPGLMGRLVTFLARPDDVVLDPYAGSCSTLEACRLNGIRAIGIERDPAVCSVAVSRFSQGVLPS